MRSPREILLTRHQGANLKLDQIRKAVVTEMTPRTTEDNVGWFPALALKLWRELIWPCRRTWMGLASVWLALVVFNLSRSAPHSAATSASVSIPRETRLALREQRQILAELMATASSPVAVPPRRLENRPRSEAHILKLV